MRSVIPFVATLLLIAPLAASADKPNIQPGEWEYKNTTTFSGDMDIPDQSETTTECVTQEDIDDGLITLDEQDTRECEIRDKQISSDAASYTMACEDPEGGTMTMSADMQFNGDSAQGTIEGEMTSEMGTIQVETRMEGTRIGDC